MQIPSAADIAKKWARVTPERTEDWEDIDRWDVKTKISWVDWMTSEKAVALRSAVLLLRDCYKQPLLVSSLIKDYVKRQVLSLDVEGSNMRLLLKVYDIFLRTDKNTRFYRAALSLRKIDPIFLVSRLKNRSVKLPA